MIPLKDDAPSPRIPYVTLFLIAACTLVFLIQRSLSVAEERRVIVALGTIPAVLLGHARLPPDLKWLPRGLTPLTSMFLHAGWMHLTGNMLYLWIYGDNVEGAFGRLRFAIFYPVCGAVAILAQALSAPDSAYPIVGASAAVSGVLGAYLVFYPRARVLTLVLLPFFVTTVRVPAMLLLLLWFAAQLLSDLAFGHSGSSIAFRAHVVGFIVGMLLARAARPRRASTAMC